MKSIYEITVFPLVSTLGLYLILNLAGALLRAALKKGWCLFQSKGNTSYQVSKVFLCHKNIKISSSVLSVCRIIPYEFIWKLVLLLLESGNFSSRRRIITGKNFELRSSRIFRDQSYKEVLQKQSPEYVLWKRCS